MRLTLAYQIACAIPEVRSHLEQTIARDPLILTKSLELQMISLIVEPLRSIAASGFFQDFSASPRLIILDGLDEILDSHVQSRTLEIISETLYHHQIHLIFLIASRPQQQISFSFSSHTLSRMTVRLVLNNDFHPDCDIRLFLGDSFGKIKATHPRLKHKAYSSPWPSSNIIDLLVQKASGQFIYASTVVKFVESIRHRPMDRLEIVLGLRPELCQMPFAELDALYTYVLSTLEDPKRTLLVLGMLMIGAGCHLSSQSEMEWFLGLNAGDVELLLADLSSLVSCNDNQIQILHASLGDFLIQPHRSGKFAINFQAVNTIAACHCFRLIKLGFLDSADSDNNRDRYVHIIGNLSIYLFNSKPTPECMYYLREPMIHYMLQNAEHLDDCSALQSYVFFSLSSFIASIQSLCLTESQYGILRSLHYDQILKAELHKQFTSQIRFYFCLVCVIPHTSRVFFTGALERLTAWNIHGKRNPIRSIYDGDWTQNLYALREFLLDGSRSEQYSSGPEAYAYASLQTLIYLYSHHLGAPVNMHHDRRSLGGKRRNMPWGWKHLRKRLAHGQSQLLKAFPRPGYHREQHPLPKLYHTLAVRSCYSKTSLLALEFLPQALDRAAMLNGLIDLASANKSFSRRAMQYPRHVERCKIAIAAYLERMTERDVA